MANVKIYKRLPHVFALAFTVLDILTSLMFDLRKIGKSHGVQFLQKKFDEKY